MVAFLAHLGEVALDPLLELSDPLMVVPFLDLRELDLPVMCVRVDKGDAREEEPTSWQNASRAHP